MQPRCSIRAVATFFLFVLLLAPSVYGQNPLDTTGRWKVMDLGMRGGFLRDDELPTGLFFLTPDLGYYVASRSYRTSNGGVTWDTMATSASIPNTMFSKLEGFGADGRRTTDGGYSWIAPTPPFPDPSRRDSITAGIAASPSRFAVMYRAQPLGGHTPRLALTTDGGATWRFLDSTYPSTQNRAGYTYATERLYDTLPVGILPPVDSVWRYEWTRFLWMSDTHLMLLARMISFPVSGGEVDRNFLWTIDVATGRGSATEIPRELGNIVMLDSAVAYSVDYPVSGTGAYNVWWTYDGGAHWDSVPYPDWLDKLSLRFISPTFGITTNSMTTDGGRAWTRVDKNPRMTQMYAIDSLNFVGAGYPSTFLRSTDAGYTWRVINDAPLSADTMLARGAQLLIARIDQSMLRSSDSGETLHEVGIGKLPDTITKIEWMIYPDTTNLSRVLALATYRGRTGLRFRGLLESRDSGETWRVGQWLNELTTTGLGGAFIGSDDQATVQFIRNLDGSGLTGYIGRDSVWMVSRDTGSTWTVMTQLPFRMKSFSMADERHGAAVAIVTYGDQGGIWTTIDGGAHWTWAEVVLPTFNNGGSIMAFDSLTYRARFVDMTQLCVEWKTFVSNDGGLTWTSTAHRDGNVPAGTMLWCDTAGVYNFYHFNYQYRIGYSSDGGNTHTELVGGDISNFDAVFGLGFPYSYFIHGSMLERLRIVSAPVGTSRVDDERPRASDVRIAPNVVAPGGSVNVSTGSTGTVDLTLLDIAGMQILSRSVPVSPQGARLDLPAGLAAGYYLLRIGAGISTTTVPLIVAF